VSAPAGTPLEGHRVLVVEDEELISLMLVDVLEELGAAVVGPAASVPDALRLVEQGGMTAALLDLSLRGETVYPVADQLAAQGVPYVFITGYGQGHLAARHGHAPVLTKPFGPDQLGELFTRVGWAAPR
jgi:CheY-like chemotaxis protein